MQFHTGFGDPDCDLRRSDPLWLRGFLERCEPRGVPVMLLHCYPFHRNAAALAQAYPHVYLDVGMTLHYVGARAAAVVAESLELAPFAKVLFSSDAAARPSCTTSARCCGAGPPPTCWAGGSNRATGAPPTPSGWRR